MRGDFGCDGQIIAGLRLLDVGDGDQADLEAPLCLFELPADRLLGYLLCREGILGRQDLEVGLCDTNDQVLLGYLVVGLGAQNPFIGLPQRDELTLVEYRLI